MCWHNGRLDESFCWRCCFGFSSEIDYDKIRVNDSGEIEIVQQDNIVENQDNTQHTQAKMPSWGDVTKGITFSTVGERDVAAEVFSRVARHFGYA